jgi:hypothetical protein
MWILSFMYGVDEINFKQFWFPRLAKQKEILIGEEKWYFGLDDFNDILCMDGCVWLVCVHDVYLK